MKKNYIKPQIKVTAVKPEKAIALSNAAAEAFQENYKLLDITNKKVVVDY
ncbi:MAG: hypothetical protein LUC92_00315 [Clostridiales bacterium]|nr:hypothetical protein [Clostridiales bacterium]